MTHLALRFFFQELLHSSHIRLFLNARHHTRPSGCGSQHVLWESAPEHQGCGVLWEGKVSGLGGSETLSSLGYWAMAGLLFHLHTLTPEFPSFSLSGRPFKTTIATLQILKMKQELNAEFEITIYHCKLFPSYKSPPLPTPRSWVISYFKIET